MKVIIELKVWGLPSEDTRVSFRVRSTFEAVAALAAYVRMYGHATVSRFTLLED